MPLKDKNSKIYLLDIRNYTWVDAFEMKPSNIDQLTIMKIIIVAICVFVGTASLIGCGFLLYKLYEIREKNLVLLYF